MEKAADVIADGRGVSGAEEETYKSLRSVRPEDNLPDSNQKYQFRIAKQRPSFEIKINQQNEVSKEAAGQGEPDTGVST